MGGDAESVAPDVAEASGTVGGLSCWFGESSSEADGIASTTANRAPHVGQVLRDALVNCSRARTRYWLRQRWQVMRAALVPSCRAAVVMIQQAA